MINVSVRDNERTKEDMVNLRGMKRLALKVFLEDVLLESRQTKGKGHPKLGEYHEQICGD